MTNILTESDTCSRFMLCETFDRRVIGLKNKKTTWIVAAGPVSPPGILQVDSWFGKHGKNETALDEASRLDQIPGVGYADF